MAIGSETNRKREICCRCEYCTASVRFIRVGQVTGGYKKSRLNKPGSPLRACPGGISESSRCVHWDKPEAERGAIQFLVDVATSCSLRRGKLDGRDVVEIYLSSGTKMTTLNSEKIYETSICRTARPRPAKSATTALQEPCPHLAT